MDNCVPLDPNMLREDSLGLVNIYKNIFTLKRIACVYYDNLTEELVSNLENRFHYSFYKCF